MSSYGGNMNRAAMAQVAIMAAVVATLAYFPLGFVLIVVFRVAGVGFDALISFGGALPMMLGLLAWWLLFFAAALVYAAVLFAWAGPPPRRGPTPKI